MDRDAMIEVVIEDMEGWLERDKESFWDHVRELERAYLESKDDKELQGIYQESV